MKLLRRTLIATTLWLIPIMLLGSFFVYFMIEYISHEETDEFLTYEMERLIDYHEKHNNLPEFSTVAEIIPDTKYNKPVFKDTLLLEPGDNEMVPYRELRFSIIHNNTDYNVVLRHLLLGSDDIAEGTIFIIIGLLLATSLSVIILINLVADKIWKPFYATLDRLKSFKITEPLPKFTKSKIDEFETLNLTLGTLLKQLADDYRNNKEFNENASHELQTHLAIIRANTEKLLATNQENEDNIQPITKIHSAASQLSQIQKSLLLLSKISNREYSNISTVDLQSLVKSSLETFAEAISLRNISLDTTLDTCFIDADAGLAGILINNLLKNAVKHNISNGFIRIELNAQCFSVANSGDLFDGDPSAMFERFSKGEKGNTGIGLAIVKQICELYEFHIEYSIKDKNIHKISIFFRN